MILFAPALASAERMLIAECEIAADDQYFEAGLRFVMLFQVDSSSESIWFVKDNELAWYGSDSPDTPFEVNGGMWSIALGADVRISMRRLRFRFIDGPFPPQTSELEDDPEICAMDYSQIQYYESGEWANDDSEETEN